MKLFLIGFIFIVIPATVYFLFWVFISIDFFTNMKWFCNKIGWHKSPLDVQKGIVHFKGKEGICPRCGKLVKSDGLGNWDEVTTKQKNNE